METGHGCFVNHVPFLLENLHFKTVGNGFIRSKKAECINAFPTDTDVDNCGYLCILKQLLFCKIVDKSTFCGKISKDMQKHCGNETAKQLFSERGQVRALKVCCCQPLPSSPG